MPLKPEEIVEGGVYEMDPGRYRSIPPAARVDRIGKVPGIPGEIVWWSPALPGLTAGGNCRAPLFAGHATRRTDTPTQEG